MSTPTESDLVLLRGSLFFQKFIAERDEILRHKWIESEKAGHDIGFEKALLDWVIRHRSCWLERWRRPGSGSGVFSEPLEDDGRGSPPPTGDN